MLIISTNVEYFASSFACVEHSPQLICNTSNLHILPSATISSVKQTSVHEQVWNSYIITSANLKISLRRSTMDNPFQTQITSVPRPVDTSLRGLLPNVPPTPLNTTNILSASNIQIEVDTLIEVDTSTPTVTEECRRIPNTKIEADISTPTATGERWQLPDTQITV